MLQSLEISFLLGAGASLQAVISAGLVKRFVKSLDLIHPKDIFEFLFWGGMVGSFVCSSVGVLVLFMNHLIGGDDLVRSWLIWWGGDVMGVFLFSTFIFLWIGENRNLWKSRRYYLSIPLLINLCVVVGILNFGLQMQRKDLKDVFDVQVHDFMGFMKYRVNEFRMALDSLHGLFVSSELVDRGEFRIFVSNLLPSMPYIESIAWAPKVKEEDREVFIQSVRAEGFENYRIKAIGGDQKEKLKKFPDVYFPILYFEPSYVEEKMLGLDNYSEARRKGALDLAMENGIFGVSSPFVLSQDQETEGKSLLFVKPVFDRKELGYFSRIQKKDLKGFVTITSKFENMIQSIFGLLDFPDGMRVAFFSEESDGSELMYQFGGGGESYAGGFREEKILNIAGKRWKIVFETTSAFHPRLESWVLWFLVVTTFLLATFLNILLLITTGQTAVVKRMVDEQTKELEEEILKHKATAEALARRGQDLEGSRIAALNIMEDTKEAMEKLEKAEAAAQEALSVKSEFTSMVSHELRTPLTVIKESVSIVYDGLAGDVNDDQKSFLETSKRNVDRLARLINDVLDYQKLDARQMQFVMKKEKINDIVRESADSFRLSLKGRGVELDLDLAEELPEMELDRDRITQVLVNLLNNAMKFTDEGRIVLRTESEGDQAVKVSVQDSGIGIRPEDKDKLFKSFSQITTGKRKNTGGTGLGLVLCKKIIEQHGGTIDVDSVEGEGSTFYFILPMKV